jgi:hypothetical protein
MEEKSVASIELVQALLDCHGELLHDRRGLAIIDCWRKSHEPRGKLPDALQRLFHRASSVECVFLSHQRCPFRGRSSASRRSGIQSMRRSKAANKCEKCSMVVSGYCARRSPAASASVSTKISSHATAFGIASPPSCSWSRVNSNAARKPPTVVGRVSIRVQADVDQRQAGAGNRGVELALLLQRHRVDAVGGRIADLYSRRPKASRVLVSLDRGMDRINGYARYSISLGHGF